MRRPSYLAVFVWMLTTATHNGSAGKMSILFNGKRKTLQPGQFTAGSYQMAEATGVPRGTVENIVQCFIAEEMIEVQTSTRYTLYTIKNWDKYQKDEEQFEERQRIRKGATEDLIKNERIEKLDPSVRNKILKALSHPDFALDDPESYLRKIEKCFSVVAIRKAHGEWHRGNGIRTPSQFFARCKLYSSKP